MKKGMRLDYQKRSKLNRMMLAIELILTIGICMVVSLSGIADLKKSANSIASEVDYDYDNVMRGYIATFQTMTLLVEEQIDQDVSFDEMMDWLQSMESKWREIVGTEIYDGFALTYKGGYAHSWNYGDYTNYDPSSRPWYKSAQAADGEIAVVAPYVTFLDATQLGNDEYILMTIAQKYNDEISFDYDLKISEIHRLLENRDYTYDGTVAILYDTEGYIISSNDNDKFAHNIRISDTEISDDLNIAVKEDEATPQVLSIKKIDGAYSLMYSQKDGKGNTLCMMAPLSQVVLNEFLLIIVITGLLILLEVYLYHNNKKSNEEFLHRDIQMSSVLSAAYEDYLYIDVDTMKVSGNQRVREILQTDDYGDVFHKMLYLAADNETRKRFAAFCSPQTLRQEKAFDGQMESEVFALRKFRSDDMQEEMPEFKDREIRNLEAQKMCAIIGRRKVVTLLYNDVTESVEILKQALADAESANRAKTDFLSRMSHDIRTPMNAIIGMTNLAKDEKDPKCIEEYLDNIDSSSQFLLGLINDILDLSKIESGEIELKPEPYGVAEFQQSINTVMKPLMDSRNIEFVFELKSNVDGILVDRLRYNQIFFNLLSNAAKYTQKGGRIEFLTEALQERDGMCGIRYYIRDNGIGMSKEFLSRLFEPFAQERADAAENVAGTGLGLPIVKNLLDIMGGTIQVTSEQGKGTEFIVELYTPRVEVEADKEETTITPFSLQGRQILLAEDNDLNILVAQRLLEKEGCHITVAKNGREAVDCFDESPIGYFDAVLMDVRMPVMDGLEATRQIRGLTRADAAQTPILAMTADAFNEEKKKTLEVGMNYHLAKPINTQMLYEKLSEYIEQYRNIENTCQT